MIIEAAEDRHPSDLDTHARRIDPELASTRVDVVFRVSNLLAAALDADDAASARVGLRERFRGRGVYALALDDQRHAPTLHRISDAGVERLPPADEPEALAQLQQHDLSELIHTSRSRCLYEALPNLHYEAPSKVHCKSFVRVGDAVLDKQSLERMTFWLRGQLVGAHVVLADTWTIALPVLQSLRAIGSGATFDALSSHPNHDPAAARVTIERMLRSVPDTARVVCVVSVTSSGRYARIVRDMFAEQGRDSVVFLGIYRLQGDTGGLPSLCDLELTPGNYLPHECPLCEQGIPLQPVDPALYYAKRIAERQVALRTEFLRPGEIEREVIVAGNGVAPPPGAPTARVDDFVLRYRGTPGLFSVHRDDVSGRHHAFYVDSLVLQDTPQFAARLKQGLAQLPRPDLVLSWSDPSSWRLAATVATRLDSPHEVVTSIGALRSGAARSAQRVVFVQAVVANAQRLDAVNRALRERQVDTPITEANFVIGLARPPSELHWRRWRSMLTAAMTGRTSQLVPIEWCPLPDWKKPVCPWCQEHAFLSSVSGRLGNPPEWLLERLTRLGNRERGLDEPLWALPGLHIPAIAHDSPVAPIGTPPLEVVFRLAAGLQRLRHADQEDLRLEPKPPLFQVFATRNLASNYTEALLHAACMRTVMCPEWGSVSQHALTTTLARLVSEGREIVLGEVLLGVARRSFGRATFDRIRPLFEKYLGEHCDAFADALLG